MKVTDDVIAIFNDMKVRKAQANEDEKKKRKKAVLFCLSKDLKNIVLDEPNVIVQGDLGTTVTDPYQHFVGMLPPNDCRYALYDATYETKETKKEDLVFIFWWGATHRHMMRCKKLVILVRMCLMSFCFLLPFHCDVQGSRFCPTEEQDDLCQLKRCH